ncbi:MAG: hypothetical protein U1F06_02030 [Steroidobacteraceae bacterium]
MDAYAAAARRFPRRCARRIAADDEKIEPGVMDLIEVAAVTEQLDALLARRG